jgi:DNA (cytosine-5)-methyltransferase 1
MTFIDLFCGCGGFSLGMERAGFECLAAIDNNAEAIKVYAKNFPQVSSVLNKDLEKFSPSDLQAILGKNRIDVIVGGPPCQGFSNVRRVDSSNHGSGVKRDKRRYLYRHFLSFVEHFQPKVFVMENVLGIQTAAKGRFFTAVQAEARELGYKVHAQVEEAWKLGVPQKRRRQLIIGVKMDIPGFFPSQLIPCNRAWTNSKVPNDFVTLGDAIGDLPILHSGGGKAESQYNLKRRKSIFANRGERAKHYLEKVLEIDKAPVLTGHWARPHNARDLRDFARLHEGEHSGEAIARGEKMEFTYNREVFKDRFKRQHREEQCSTIVAHLSKDGLMFIHPTQNRSLTPREAARIQSFPDWFEFCVARTHQFKVIGNAVPPLVAEAVGQEINTFLSYPLLEESSLASAEIPPSKDDAIKRLLPIINLNNRDLRKIPTAEFKLTWYSITYLCCDLHPDSALDNGEETSKRAKHTQSKDSISEILEPYYVRSGWPVKLAVIANEAWRRYQNKELKSDEFYCTKAQQAGYLTKKHVNL